MTLKDLYETKNINSVLFQKREILSIRIEENESIEDELMDNSEGFTGTGHKIGGYAFFTQTDPRIDEPKFEEYILLFQLDSIGEINWGDAGVGHLFIHPDDLAKKDFSKVVYHFDCY